MSLRPKSGYGGHNSGHGRPKSGYGGRLVPPLLVGMLVAGLVSACSGGGDSGRIRLGRVALADVAEVVEAPATVAARATATLRSPAEGTVKRLYVTTGDRVRQGEVLAKIDSPTARDQLRQARDADNQAAGGEVVPAGVNLTAFQSGTDRTARRGFDAARRVAKRIQDPAQRARVLAEIAKAEADYRTAAAAARAAVARLNAGLGSVGSALSSITAAQRVQTRAAVRSAERTVRALTIKAPFDGVVGLGGPAGGGGGLGNLTDQLSQLQAQGGAGGGGAAAGNLSGLSGLGGGAARDAASVAVGAPVGNGDAIVTITDVSKLSLAADVDETDVLQVDEGVEANVEFDAVPGATYTAVVTGVGVTPKQATGGGVTYPVTLALRAGKRSDGSRAPWPKPGMSAIANLRVREVRNAVSVPSSAVVTSGRDSTVWVVSGGRAQRRVVHLGAQGDTVVQVTSGLRTGEQIVVRGVDAVKQGQDLS